MTKLKDLAEQKGILFGATLAVEPLKTDKQYRRLAASEFNIVTAENAMKYMEIHPDSAAFNFQGADLIVDFALKNKQKIRGHTLVWHGFNPAWLTDTKRSSSELRVLLEDHLRTTVSRYKGKIYVWDVVNEALMVDGRLYESIWREAFGDGYIEQVLKIVHEVDPDAKLFLNDWGLEDLNPKSEAMYGLLTRLLDKGVPIHGVGVQMHLGWKGTKWLGQPPNEDPPNIDGMTKTLNRFGDLGLDIHITEMDIAMYRYEGSREEKLQVQAQMYADVVGALLTIKGLRALTTWGVADKYSWISGYFGLDHADTPLLFDEDYQPKPAYEALIEVFSQ